MLRGEAAGDEVIGECAGREVFDALADPAEGAVLARLMQQSAPIDAAEGTVSFHWTDHLAPIGDSPSVRPMGVEQSNSTIVLDDAVALKVFRRLLPGDNPELEMLRFLSAHGFENIAELGGWYEFSGNRLEATLGVTLFARTNRQLQLTDAGRMLIPWAEKVLRDVEDLTAAVRDVRELAGGTVSFGTFSSAHLYLLPALTAEFGRLHPDVSIRVQGLNSSEVADAVAFLLGPSGSAFTGAPLVMDGGWTAR